MIVEAFKKDGGYFIPIKGKKDKIKVYIEEDIDNLDILSNIDNIDFQGLTEEEIKAKYKEDVYREYLLLDEKTMHENWEHLVKTKKDWGDGFEELEEAVSDWKKA